MSAHAHAMRSRAAYSRRTSLKGCPSAERACANRKRALSAVLDTTLAVQPMSLFSRQQAVRPHSNENHNRLTRYWSLLQGHCLRRTACLIVQHRSGAFGAAQRAALHRHLRDVFRTRSGRCPRLSRRSRSRTFSRARNVEPMQPLQLRVPPRVLVAGEALLQRALQLKERGKRGWRCRHLATVVASVIN